MKIKVINPNTTASMTRTIDEAAKAAAAPGTTIVTTNPSMGPVSIEGHYDEAMAALGVIDEVLKGEAEGCDGYVIACFGDPGLLAAREAARGPVVGIAEAAMHMASLVSTGFSIVSTLARSRAVLEHLVDAYGMRSRCRSVRATNIAVLDLEKPETDARAVILAECRRAVDQDHAEAVLLGCAGMADLQAAIASELSIPVVDGVASAVKLVESAVMLGLRTSKIGGLADPLPKAYVGELERFAPGRVASAEAAE